jgi:hypothetical protein
MVIWKYELSITAMQEIEVPLGAKVLSAKMQDQRLCLWAMVDPNEQRIRMPIEIIGTGHKTSNCCSREFIDTVIDGPFVWHIFRRI